jgi:type II secretory pathway component PulC
MAIATIFTAVLVAACGGSQSRAEPAAPSDNANSAADGGPRAVASPDAPLPSRPGRLWRRDVVATLSRGLGDFLSRLQIEPALGAGKFQGWRIVKLKADDPLWQNKDLAPGDVVTSVNGRPIERPEQAFAAFQSLAIAKELRVQYDRGGAHRELVYPIDEDPSAK